MHHGRARRVNPLVALLASALWVLLARHPDPAPGATERGASGPGLALWLAREADRQGRITLNQQETELQTLQTRTSAMLGWIVTAGLATVAAVFTQSRPEWRGAAIMTLSLLGISAALCVVLLFPWKTQSGGVAPRMVLDTPLADELEVTQSIALGIENVILRNQTLLKWLRLGYFAAWIGVILAIVAGVGWLEYAPAAPVATVPPVSSG